VKSYHWIITIQFWPPPGIVTTTYGAGTIIPSAGQTRGQVFGHLHERMLAQAQADPQLQGMDLNNPVVVFFSLEPDEL